MSPPLNLVVAALVASTALAGCIGNELPSADLLGAPPATRPMATFTARDYSLTGPATVPAGWVDIAVRNLGEDWHHAYVLRLDPGRTVEEFERFLEAGRGPPAWARAVGGPNAVDPGLSAVATSFLEPGQYVVLCVIPDGEHVAHYLHGMVTSFVVEGPARGAEPKADQTVHLADFAFGPDKPLRAGERTIAYVNDGEELHEAVLVRLDAGRSLDDLMAVMGGEAPGPLPATFIGGVVGLEPGGLAYITDTFEPGTYAYLCFFGEEKGEPPHFTKGMLLEFEVA